MRRKRERKKGLGFLKKEDEDATRTKKDIKNYHSEMSRAQLFHTVLPYRHDVLYPTKCITLHTVVNLIVA